MNRNAMPPAEQIRPVVTGEQIVNMVQWFYDAMRNCTFIKDERLRNDAFTEVIAAFRLVRHYNAPPRVRFQEGEEGEALDRRV